MTLDQVRAALANWVGMEPTSVARGSKRGAGSGIEVLLFHVTEQPGVPRDEEFAYLATAGLSEAEASDNDDRRVELVMRVDGHRPRTDLEKLARGLADFADECASDGSGATDGAIIEGVRLPLFEQMDHLLIANWGGTTTRLSVNPTIFLMSVYPLYASEVEDVRRLGPEHARDAFEKKGINLSDPDRPAANLSRQKGSARKRVSGPKHASGSVRSVRQSWKAIETWYSKHVPEMFKGLKPGASEDDIEAYAKQLKVDLPRDYIESLKLHDGETDLGEWTYLSIEAALENWRRKQGLLRKQQPGASQRVKGRGDGKMQEVWWDPAWIPFAEDSGGNLLCLDLHPDIDGTVGQVLDIDMEDGPSLTEYDSFAEWLESFWHDLKANAYKIDRSGWLVPK